MSSVGRQALADSLSALENIAVNYITEWGKREKAQEAQLMNSLLTLQLQEEQANRQWMTQQGLKLPEYEQTQNYDQIIKNSGNTKYTNKVESMIAEAERRNQEFSNIRSRHNQGIQLAQDLTKAGATEFGYYDQGNLPTETFIEDEPIDQYMFSQEELDALKKRGDITEEEWVDEIFMGGFRAGSADLDIATNRLAADQKIEGANLALNEKKIELADTNHRSSVDLVGQNIITHMSQQNIAIGGLKNIMEKEGGREHYDDEILPALTKLNKKFPNTIKGLLGAIDTYAGPGTTDYDNHMGFVRLAADAYDQGAMIARIERAALGSGLIQLAEGDVITQEHKNMLKEKFPEYRFAQVKLDEYYSIFGQKLMTDNKTLEQAWRTVNVGDNILSAKLAMPEEVGLGGLYEGGIQDINTFDGIDPYQVEMADMLATGIYGRLDKGEGGLGGDTGGSAYIAGHFNNPLGGDIVGGTEISNQTLIDSYKRDKQEMVNLQTWIAENPKPYWGDDDHPIEYSGMGYKELQADLIEWQKKAQRLDDLKDTYQEEVVFPGGKPVTPKAPTRIQYGQAAQPATTDLNKAITIEDHVLSLIGDWIPVDEIITDEELDEDLGNANIANDAAAIEIEEILDSLNTIDAANIMLSPTGAIEGEKDPEMVAAYEEYIQNYMDSGQVGTIPSYAQFVEFVTKPPLYDTAE